jgi:hypothetical protein
VGQTTRVPAWPLVTLTTAEQAHGTANVRSTGGMGERRPARGRAEEILWAEFFTIRSRLRLEKRGFR